MKPFLQGEILDLFAGDLSVAEALSEASSSRIYAAEWPDQSKAPQTRAAIEFIPLCTSTRLDFLPGSTLILSTSLHHVSDPLGVIEDLSKGSWTRWVVIENCIDEVHDAELHLAADLFFNKCLNQSDLPCVAQHRTAESWRCILNGLGYVSVEERRLDVPGIFLPHTLFVLERRTQ